MIVLYMELDPIGFRLGPPKASAKTLAIEKGATTKKAAIEKAGKSFIIVINVNLKQTIYAI